MEIDAQLHQYELHWMNLRYLKLLVVEVSTLLLVANGNNLLISICVSASVMKPSVTVAVAAVLSVVRQDCWFAVDS